MKSSSTHNSDKTNFRVKKTKTNKKRFLIIASFLIIAISSTAALSSTSASGTLNNILFGDREAALPTSFETSIWSKFAAPLSYKSAPVSETQPTEQADENPARITTDRTDYKPGETVIVTGSGFAVYEPVSLEIKREDVLAARYQVSADEFGNIINREFTISETDLGASFVVTAVGTASGKTAESKFTDGTISYSPVTQSYIGAGAIVSSASAQNVVFSQSVITASGVPNAYTVVPDVARQAVTDSGVTYNALPAGYVVSVAPTSLSFVACNGTNNNNCTDTLSWNVTITVPANAVLSGGSTLRYAVNVKAKQTSPTNPNQQHLSGNGTNILLEIKSPQPADATAPTTTATAAANGNSYVSNAWTKQNVTVDLSASDNTGGVGVGSLTYTVTGPDNVPATTTISRSPFTASIPVSAEGNTTIAYFAKDLLNNTEATKYFYVNIDKTAPALSLPSGINVQADNANGKVVEYTATATDRSPASPTVTCSPASGSTFPIGETTVNCSATDTVGNTATGSFKVTVGTAPQNIIFGALDNKTYGDADFPVSAAASSGLPVTFAASGNCNLLTGNVVHITGAGSCTITASQSGSSSYSAAENAQQQFTISAKSLTANITADNKVYDGTTAATILTRTFSAGGVVGSDDVTLTGGTATFDTKNVGTGKTVTATGITLGGSKASNYVLGTVATTTANITAKNLTVNGAMASNKTYDGLTSANIDFSGATLAGVIAPDAVTINSSGYTADFNNKNIGTGKAVTVSGISLSETGAGNYTVSQLSGLTANITAKNLTVSGATANNKVYDGGTSATVNFTDAKLNGVIGSENVGINNAGYSASFDNKNIGAGKPVTVTGIALNRTDAGNYTVSQLSGLTAEITAATVTGSFTADNKLYDGTTAATISGGSLKGVIGSDNASLNGGTASFDNKNVGNGKTVTANGFNLSGSDAGNYILAAGPLTTTANITARTLTLSATGVNKVYDGSTTAAVNLSGDKLTADVVSARYTGAAFANKNVGTGKAVSVSGISISGDDAGNYTFNTTAATTADITAKGLNVSAAGVNKIYDGNTTATVNLSDNRVSDDALTTSYTSASFDNKDAGMGKTVSVSGISISGTDAGNYTFNTTATTTANITGLLITGTITAANKVYDGNTTAAIATRTLTGVIGSDDVSLTGGTAAFDNANVGTGKTVTGTGFTLGGTAAAGNYTLGSVATTTANIMAKSITANVAAAGKTYDGNANATITGCSLSGLITGDTTGCATSSTAADNQFSDANAGTSKAVTAKNISLTNNLSGNYVLSSTTATTTANISKAASTTVVSCPASVEYPGSAATPCNAVVTGVGLSQTPTVGYTNNTGVGTATASASYAGDPNHNGSSDSKTFAITARDALVRYIGQTSWVTSGTSSTTAQVTLTASVQDPTGTALSGAKVNFIDQSNNKVLASNVTVSPVAGSTANTGTANTTVTLSSGQYGAESYVILVKMTGNYENEAQTTVDKTATLVVSKPAATNETIGTGTIAYLPTSAGTYRSDIEAAATVTVGMAYNKSGTNQQGKITVTIPQSDGIVYLKSNSISSMTVTGTTSKQSTIYTKSTVYKVLSNGTTVTLDGNVTLRLDAVDNGTTGTGDKIGITSLSSGSVLYYSNNWVLDSVSNAWKTVPQDFASGIGVTIK